jgi:aminobenzoyl-glutamate transport protein
MERFLSFTERAGNALPHPAILFAIASALVILISGLTASIGLQSHHPVTGESIRPVSLLNIAGLHRMIDSAVENFTGFAPLGTVLVAMLGIGVAESTGLIGAVLRLLVLSAPKKLLTLVIVFAGVISNTASEVGYVLLVPLAAMVFLAVGRHPIAGLAAAFAGVSGGYSANLLLGTVDPLLAGLSQEAARLIDKAYVVNPAANYYFMAVSTFLVTLAGTWVTERIVVPRLGNYKGEERAVELHPLSGLEKRGLVFAGIATVAFVAFILVGVLPANGFLRDLKTGDILHSPLLSGVVTFIFLGGLLIGAAYGIGTGTLRSSNDIVKGMSKTLETLGGYLVLVFFAAQFVAYFGWTNLGMIVAVEGAEFLRSMHLGGIPLMLGVIIFAASVNMLMGSASAKWAILAPIFVPMLMLLGYTPELTQTAFRIGDSVTNIISPMMSYFALIIAFVQRYDKAAGIGTLIATMLPYTVTFTIAWSLLLVGWMLLGLPVGPGAGLYLEE